MAVPNESPTPMPLNWAWNDMGHMPSALGGRPAPLEPVQHSPGSQLPLPHFEGAPPLPLMEPPKPELEPPKLEAPSDDPPSVLPP